MQPIPVNNGGIEEWEGKTKKNRLSTTKQEVKGVYDLQQNLYLFSWERKRIVTVPAKAKAKVPKPGVKIEEKVVEDHVVKIEGYEEYDKLNRQIS
ncbi:hypothetical protein Tco_0965914 [Tanacetum coccineum]